MAKRQVDEYVDIQSNITPKSKKKKKKKMRARDRVIMAVSILLIVVSLCTVGAIALLNWRPLTDDGDVLGNTKTPEALKEKSVNFLVCGIDFEEGTSRAKMTDVIMVVNFDIQGKKVNILQIPRDTLIGQEETATGKINAVYQRPARYGTNGMAGLAEVINKKFKINIDYYATVTMTAFRKVVDALGGVEVDVPQTISWEGTTVKKGKQVLKGEQAEKFVRVRKGQGGGLYDGSDTNRVKMQRIFMAALAKKLTSVSKSTLIGVITKVMGDVTTDMSVGDVISFAGVMQGVDLSNMSIAMLPGQGGYYKTAAYGNQSVYYLHKDETCDLLNKYFRQYQDPLSPEELDIIETTDKKITSNDDNANDFQELADGAKPGQKSTSSSGK